MSRYAIAVRVYDVMYSGENRIDCSSTPVGKLQLVAVARKLWRLCGR